MNKDRVFIRPNPDDPIVKEHRRVMNDIAAQLDDIFDGMSFCLVLFSNEADSGRMFNYISNANRDDVLTAMQEWIDANKETEH